MLYEYVFAYKKAHILLPPPHGCDVIESKASLRSSPGGRGRKSATIGTPLKLDVPLLPQKPMNNIRHKGQGRISLCAEFNFNCDMRNFCDVSGVVTTASNWYYCIIIIIITIGTSISRRCRRRLFRRCPFPATTTCHGAFVYSCD